MGHFYVALRTPTKGQPLGTYNWTIKESQHVKGLRSKLNPEEACGLGHRMSW